MKKIVSNCKVAKWLQYGKDIIKMITFQCRDTLMTELKCIMKGFNEKMVGVKLNECFFMIK